jgi:4-hydroxy-3-methylbut-2-enyl diphosphate reductase
MTDTIPRPRDAEDLTEPRDPLLLCAPLRIEARALRRGLRAAGGSGGVVPPGQHSPDPPAVTRTGYGTTRAAQQAGRLSRDPFGQLMIMGVGGGLSTDLSPGDLVVGTEVGAVTCASAPILAGELRRAGLGARTGRITTVDHLVRRAERAKLAADGWLLADMESAPLAGAAAGRPVAVIRAVSDTPHHPLVGIVSGGLAALRSLRAAAPVAQRWAAACGTRQVLLAGPRSFCAGVERAIEIVERVLERQGPHGQPVYVRKQIVHNTRVVGDLERRGAVFVDELDQVPDGATVVFSAHGVVLVAGSANSSNSVRLVETCERAGTPAHLIDGASDIQLDWLAGVSTIGLTAGASAPPAVVEEIISALSGLGPLTVQEKVTTTESIRFGLPKEVRQ